MNHIQKQSILILITGIEQQLQSLKVLVGLSESVAGGVPQRATKPALDPFSHTTEEEDEEIGRALQVPEDEKDLFLQDIFKEAGSTLNESGN